MRVLTGKGKALLSYSPDRTQVRVLVSRAGVIRTLHITETHVYFVDRLEITYTIHKTATPEAVTIHYKSPGGTNNETLAQKLNFDAMATERTNTLIFFKSNTPTGSSLRFEMSENLGYTNIEPSSQTILVNYP